MREGQLLTIHPNMTEDAAALSLLQAVMRAESKSFDAGTDGAVSRKWILDTFAECLLAVKAPQQRD